MMWLKAFTNMYKRGKRMKIEYSISDIIITFSITNTPFLVLINEEGQYDGTDFLYCKGDNRWYAPIIEEGGNFYTEEEYYSSSVE